MVGDKGKVSQTPPGKLVFPKEALPKVSIIIPTYNCAEYITETLDSALKQTYKNCETIVVDDGSTDNTREVLAPFMDKIAYIYQENSRGPGRPRNVGIKKSKGKYISLLDSDDILLPEKIETAVALFEAEPSLGMVFANFVKCDESGKTYPETHLDSYEHFLRMDKTKVNEKQFIIPGKVALNGLFYENFIGISGVVIPKEVFSKVGLFDESFSPGGLEDRDMWFRIARCYDIGYLDTVGHLYRLRSNSVSKRNTACAQARINVIRKHSKHAKSNAVRKQAKFLIAQCFYDIGYHYQSEGDLRKARKFYLQSLREAFHLPPLKGTLITLMGSKALQILKTRRDLSQ
jgi:glycosyltransferase involved in cell wall biosynthesis